jgi:hypothetical protein
MPLLLSTHGRLGPSLLLLGAAAAGGTALMCVACFHVVVLGRHSVVETTRAEHHSAPPDELDADDNDAPAKHDAGSPQSSWVVVCERVVSRPLALPALLLRLQAQQQQRGGRDAPALSEALDVYLRTSMQLFVHTPQAWLST